jgi:glycosyltransferase involved in cell wall biosynthesis
MTPASYRLGFVSFFNLHRRYPRLAEFQAFCDMSAHLFPDNQINGAQTNLTTSPLIYIDVTQYSKQFRHTGIQRIVKAFIDYSVSDARLVPVVFENGRYLIYSINESQALQDRLSSKYSISSFRVLITTFAAKIWHGLVRIMRIRDRNIFKTLELKARYLRDLLLGATKAEELYLSRLPVEELLEGILFIPDLPSNPSHLDTLFILQNLVDLPTWYLVHDLIPLSDPELMPPYSSNNFEYYAKIISNARGLFFSSLKIKEDYELIRPFYQNTRGKQNLIHRTFPQISNRIKIDNEPLRFQSNGKAQRQHERLGVFGSTPFLLGIGSIFQRKNYGVVVRALALLEKNGIDCNLVIASHNNFGDPGFDYSRKLLKTNKVIYLQEANDAVLSEYIKESLAVVYPSLAEGFGLPISEALGLKKFVLANRIRPISDIYGRCSNVILVEENSANAWFNAVLELIYGLKKWDNSLKENFDGSLSNSWNSYASEVVSLISYED